MGNTMRSWPSQLWLQENELENDNTCIIRRVITPDGRSKNYINGRAG